MKKRLFLFMLSICFLFTSVGVFSACADNKTEGKIKIVTTIFPVYDWTLNILGENKDVTIKNLLNSSVDLHSYQPSVADIAAIATCDLFIYVGGESDNWVEDALRNATNNDMVVIKLLDVIDSALEEEEKDASL
ncbi:MAG: zinc ABC transporter substrate-binding protein [Clostridiales bacterium]|nr:zinc ABC transporter substrate-binding protein [Clostridiales bacterium]